MQQNFLEQFPFYSRAKIREVLKLNGGAIRKRWGQNYLIEPNTLARLANYLAAPSNSKVLEIGPGLGALTRELLVRQLIVYCIEIDPVSCNILQQGFSSSNNHLFIKRADALQCLAQLDQDREFSGFVTPAPDHKDQPITRSLSSLATNARPQLTKTSLHYICGNLPYYISSKLLENIVKLESIKTGCFLLQKEFAQRIPISKNGNSLSVYLNNFGIWQKKETVGSANFYPRPNIESAILMYQPHLTGPHANPIILEKILRMSYMAKRKKLLNSWQLDQRHLLDPELLMSQATLAGIDPQKRAQEIEASSWYELSRLVEIQLKVA